MRRDTRASQGTRRPIVRAVGLVAALAAPLVGCTEAQRVGESSSYLIIDSLRGASGAAPDEYGGTLASDVLTYVDGQVGGEDVQVPTIFADNGQVSFRLALKDPGTVETPNLPSPTNYITINRYRVNFVRADGRNTPGVDVPYPFDGGLTVTVGDTAVLADFTLVRVQAKEEAPLKALAGFGGAIDISTIAEVTFYGQDQAGREVSVTGQIGVNFADWGDPD